MDWGQFMEWYSYARLEPFGEERADLRAGIVASTIANCHRDPKKRAKPFSPTDPAFMPLLDRRKSARAPLTDPKAWGALKSRLKSYGSTL